LTKRKFLQLLENYISNITHILFTSPMACMARYAG
jgi:hypothetical protein